MIISMMQALKLYSVPQKDPTLQTTAAKKTFGVDLNTDDAGVSNSSFSTCLP